MHLKMGLYLRVHSKFIFKIKNFGRSWKREEYRHKEWLKKYGTVTRRWKQNPDLN